MQQFKIPDRIVEHGVNVRPRSAIKPEDPDDLPFETRPGVWTSQLMPFYNDPDSEHYRRFSRDAEMLGEPELYKAECEFCFWRLSRPRGCCFAFPGGIPRDLETHLYPVPGDSGICFLGQIEAGLMLIPELLSLEDSQGLMKRVIQERKHKSAEGHYAQKN